MQATASFRFFGFVRQSDFWEIPQEVGVRDDHPGDIRGLLPDTYTLWRVIFFITIICAANFIVDIRRIFYRFGCYFSLFLWHRNREIKVHMAPPF